MRQSTVFPTTAANELSSCYTSYMVKATYIRSYTTLMLLLLPAHVTPTTRLARLLEAAATPHSDSMYAVLHGCCGCCTHLSVTSAVRAVLPAASMCCLLVGPAVGYHACACTPPLASAATSDSTLPAGALHCGLARSPISLLLLLPSCLCYLLPGCISGCMCAMYTIDHKNQHCNTDVIARVCANPWLGFLSKTLMHTVTMT